ncbi:alpha/beta fold hydrolase [Streptomyces sp. FR-108]|uniref:alpha/beta fold hydrolase n=1 Tax=Streptomyces sp. FR-108 TaxID=3416665 RepID=UPI003CF1E3B8
MATHTVELPVGTVEYEDTGGDGPVLVLLHGLLMDGSLWMGVVDGLRADHRCVVPVLPLGAHTLPMPEGADLSPRGLARLVAQFLDRLDLKDVILVGNDTGGALVQLMLGGLDDRLGGIVLVSCDAYDNFPPGLTGRTVVLTGKLPPALFGAFMQQLRLKPVRRLPIAFGRLTKRGDAVTAGWLRPLLKQPAIRRDTVRVLRGISAHRTALVEAAERLPSFDRPALVVWAEKDRVMPADHGRRLAAALPQGRLVEVPDSYSLLPLDQPAALARAIRAFTRA